MFRTIRSALALTLLTTILAPYAGAEGYLWEGIDVGIYKSVSNGHESLRNQLLTKKAATAEPRLKEAMGKQCGKSSPDLFANATFSPDELEELSRGNADALQKRFKPGAKMNTDTAECILSAIGNDYARMKQDTASKQETLETIGSFGVYSDGNAKNSSFDLMSDLETMHDILFSKDIPYNGRVGNTSNSTANNLANALRATGKNGLSALSDNLSFSDRLSYDLSDAGWKLPDSSGSTIPSFTPLCAQNVTSITGLDLSGLGIGTGSVNTDEDGTDPENSDVDVSYGESSVMDGGETLADAQARTALAAIGDAGRFPCSNFFCINVDITSYSQYLLGGKNYSIEGLLQDHLKRANIASAMSFVQTKMTRNFFQMSLRDLDLPSMAHIGVVVSSLPAPILNLKGQNTPRGAPSESDDEKNMNEYVSNVFKDYGLDVKRENNLLEDLPKNHAIGHLEELNTDQAWAKFIPPRRYSSNYAAVKQNEKKNEYSGGFVDDLTEFEAFIHAFADSSYSFAGLIDKFYEIPVTR